MVVCPASSWCPGQRADPGNRFRQRNLILGADSRFRGAELAQYNASVVEGYLWQRTELSARDRSLVTVAALTARNQSGDLAAEIDGALNSGLEPGRRIRDHHVRRALHLLPEWPGQQHEPLDPYSSSTVSIQQSCLGRNVDLLEQDTAAKGKRAAGVEHDYGLTAPGIVQFTTDAVFGDLRLRPDLTHVTAAWRP